MTVDRSEPPHQDLRQLRLELLTIHDAMSTFAPRVAKPPVLDSSLDLSGDANASQNDAIPGLRVLRDAIKRDLDVLEKFLDDPNSACLAPLSTNAPYLIAVWKEVLVAPPPITAIWKTFYERDNKLTSRNKGSQQQAGTKVDVVADGGRQWIRVNTTKNSRLLAEFREIDSYQTDSEDEDDDNTYEQPTLAQAIFDNSIIRMGRSLLTASQANPLPDSSQIRRIILRLTRLDPAPKNVKEHDDRIARSIQELRNMGIDVQLGERPSPACSSSPSPTPRAIPRPLEPTTNINLDLSTLIALVSDLTHSPLPQSPSAAEKRFIPSQQYLEWKKKRIAATQTDTSGDVTKAVVDSDPSDDWETSQGTRMHSRALSNQALQEMGRGLVREMHDRLSLLKSTAVPTNAASIDPFVAFWTTPEARDRCLKIVAKIGGPGEKRRARALFPSVDTSLEEAKEAYWQESRYETGYIPLLPIRLLPSGEPDAYEINGREGDNEYKYSSFFSQLEHTCREILAQEMRDQTDVAADDEGGDGEIQRAAVTRANPRLTTHTVQSMLWGAARGWTTLTANKTSVKAVLREMKASNGAAKWGVGEIREDGRHKGAERAAIWMVDPRSLAEGMRSDYTG